MLGKTIKLSAVFILFALVGAAPKPSTQRVRESMDHVAYPEATGDRMLKEKLPMVGSLFGEVPENVSGGKWRSVDGGTESAGRLHDKLVEAQIGLEGLQFFTNGGAGSASDTLVSLRDGRICRVVLLLPTGTTWEGAGKMLRDFRVQTVKPEHGQAMQKLSGTIDRHGVKFTASAIGFWERTTPDEEKKIIQRNGSVKIQIIPGHRESGPRGFVFDVDVLSWIFAHNVRAPFRDAAMQHKLQAGMNEREAIITMRGTPFRRTDLGESVKLEFFRRDLKIDNPSAAVQITFNESGPAAEVQLAVSAEITTEDTILRTVVLKNDEIVSLE